VGLEEHEDLQESSGTHSHTLPEIHDTPWHVWARTMGALMKKGLPMVDILLPVSLMLLATSVIVPHTELDIAKEPDGDPSYVPPQFTYTLERTGDVHDFDFIGGVWKVHNRRLKARGVGSNEWDVFPGDIWARVLMNGVVNVDEVDFPTKGWKGTTFRHFDLEKRQWSIYWVNNRDGKMQSPVWGGFEGNVGLFFGEDTDEGRPIKVVYRWTRLGPDYATWEQAFSYDDGKSWETNWKSEHVRVKR